MPIRLNLLAETKAVEDARRRDPVKRTLWLAGLAIAGMLAWSSFLQLRVTLASNELAGIEAQIGARSNAFQHVLDDQRRTVEIEDKLRSLTQLASSRFLNGTLLNAFQYTSVEDVQLTHLHVDQQYVASEGTKTRTNDDNVVIRGKPPTRTERIVLNVEGMDLSSGAGDQVNRFTSALTSSPYFKDVLTKTNPVSLKSLSPPQVAPVTGRPCVTFNLECRYTDKTL